MDARQQSPSVARNRAPILAVLQRVLPPEARVLELASGTGEHAVFFGETLPGVSWQTSDPDPDARDSIAAWIRTEGVANVLAARAIDVSAAVWDVEGPFDAMVAINLIHISPWQATLGLMGGPADCCGPAACWSPMALTSAAASIPRRRTRASISG